MEYVTTEHLKLLLNKEWMVKNDNAKSIPYLLKFYASPAGHFCCFIITDTKQVWGEALSSKLFARRWRDCNHKSSSFSPPLEEDESIWRSQILELLSNVHTLGGIIDLSFEVIESRNADLAIELGSGEFKWRWESYSLGPKVSADVLSQHLIMPLISVTHLAFSSADPVSELSEADLEKAVDKVGRTARRSVDTHLKHAVTKPRVATALSRMNAVLNFIPEQPAILTEVSTPTLHVPVVTESVPSTYDAAADPSPVSQDGNKETESDNEPPASPPPQKPAPLTPPPVRANDDDSVTEAETDEEQAISKRSAGGQSKGRTSPSEASGSSRDSRSRESSPKPSGRKSASATQDMSSDSPPARPTKKTKLAETSSDEDSEAERSQRPAQRKSALSSRGAKQPIKRGGRRF